MTTALKSKSKWALLSVALAGLMLTACNSNNNAPAEGESAAAEAGGSEQTIRIATESSYKPLSYTDADGKLIGFEIDLIHALCDEMKAKCDISSQEWDGLIPGLQAKKFDAIIAGMSITPERLEKVDFTDPYLTNGLVLVAKKGDNISVDSDFSTIPVGAQRATIAAQYIEETHPKAKLNLYDTQENAYLDLASGRIRALFSDKVTAAYWLTSEEGKAFEQKGAEFKSDDTMGIAVRKGDALAGKFNTALATLKQSGKYDEISAPYFGTTSTAAAQAAAN
ncbi:ABC transporter substrate-binding protein [Psychrobacter sanguinis]|uniref:ABC transporter substrate-binding protein n=1 Tax=Psychrobacter sanguinis TaxID=861445 RepID=UPI00020C98FB|nr:ABC transporter substrate-binding protein [Psychrobacter sanguinis]EGK08120.1 arginine ABC superfamily ATP binding cassette transporter, binding protein [Psychrobacter sp. 1501(2011)]MCD9152120.1 ABC transporter substrate-binding protein [Psychrobacter sanguinis]